MRTGLLGASFIAALPSSTPLRAAPEAAALPKLLSRENREPRQLGEGHPEARLGGRALGHARLRVPSLSLPLQDTLRFVAAALHGVCLAAVCAERPLVEARARLRVQVVEVGLRKNGRATAGVERRVPDNMLKEERDRRLEGLSVCASRDSHRHDRRHQHDNHPFPAHQRPPPIRGPMPANAAGPELAHVAEGAMGLRSVVWVEREELMQPLLLRGAHLLSGLQDDAG